MEMKLNYLKTKSRLFNPTENYFYLFLFYYPVIFFCNISLRGMISDHRSDTYVLGTNDHTSLGY